MLVIKDNPLVLMCFSQHLFESIRSILCEFCERLYRTCTNSVILLFALQVQRRQKNKPFVSCSSEPPAQELLSTVIPLKSMRDVPPNSPYSSTAASELAEGTVPDQTASLLSRLEAASANFEDNSTKASKMERLAASGNTNC